MGRSPAACLGSPKGSSVSRAYSLVPSQGLPLRKNDHRYGSSNQRRGGWRRRGRPGSGRRSVPAPARSAGRPAGHRSHRGCGRGRCRWPGDWVQLDGGRVAGPLGVQPVAVGRPRPGQQLPAAQPRLPPAPHLVGDQGPFILGDRAADLGHQLLVGVVAQGGGHRTPPAPRGAPNSSSTTIWCTKLRASRSGAVTRTTSKAARAAWSRSASRPGGPAWRRCDRRRGRCAPRRRSTHRGPRPTRATGRLAGRWSGPAAGGR
jgi:hypothetical protein